MTIYDRPEISAAYFFPRPCDPLPSTARAAPVDLCSDDGTRIGAYWCRPLDGAPTVLYFHGNGEIIADQLEHWPAWAEAAGANIFFVDYPGYATSDGSPSLTGCCRAAAAALGKVYCFGPTFRAEKSKTRRHLTEFWMVEPEVAWLDSINQAMRIGLRGSQRRLENDQRPRRQHGPVEV